MLNNIDEDELRSEKIIRKLNNIFENTIDNELKYDGSLENINYYNLLCKAAAIDSLFEINGSNVCMFNYNYEDLDSILIIFSVPLNSDEDKKKVRRVSEKVIQIISICEKAFITLDYTKSLEIEEEKFIYITIVKKIKNKEKLKSF